MLAPNLVLLITLNVGQVLVPSDQINQKKGSDPRCGSFCIYVALKSLDIGPNNFEAFEKGLGKPGSLGYSMAELSAYAEKLGAHVLGVETSLSSLTSRKQRFACMAQLSFDHFVLIHDVSDTRVSLIDPPQSYSVPKETFSKIWTGKALLVSDEPIVTEETLQALNATPFYYKYITPAIIILSCTIIGVAILLRTAHNKSRIVLLILGSTAGVCGCAVKTTDLGPVLVIEPAVHELGDIVRHSSHQTKDITSKVSNRGTRVLVIKTLRTNCGCVSVTIGRKQLRPGESTNLTARIIVGDSPDPRTSELFVTSNDERMQEHRLRFAWRSTNPLTVRAISAKPTLRVNEEYLQRYEIRALRSYWKTGMELRIHSPSPDIECKLTVLPTGADREVPRTGAALDDITVGEFTALIHGDSKPGEFQRVLYLVVVNRGVECGRLEVPVAWRTVAPIQMVPARIYLGIRKLAEMEHQRIVLSSSTDAGFAVTGVTTSEGAKVEFASDSTEQARMHIVAITVRLPSAVGPWRTVLRIGTTLQDCPIIELPISANVEP